MISQTEFPFTLPHGYLDAEGTCHREGVMRTLLSDADPRAAPFVNVNELVR